MTQIVNGDVPDDLLADPIAPEVVWDKGSLGSPVLALRGGHPDVLERMADLYAERFRKGWRDLKAGIAVFMAPLIDHETGTAQAYELALALCVAQGLPVVDLRSTTLRAAQDGDARKGDPDQSFLIGETAARYRAIRRRQGLQAANDAFRNTAADLAVEVEHTHYDATKHDIYRAAGVSELWEFGTALAKRKTAIIDLQAPDGPCPAAVSRVVPGVRADGLNPALELLREIGGYGDFRAALALGESVARRLLATVGVEGPARSEP